MSKWTSKYFALEPYSATLYEYCNGKYKGPVPNESQVFYQITNGVSYLHGKGIVHGDLNPLNVVIAAQSRPVRMKISDFGLSKFSYSKQLSENEDNISFEVKLCLRKYWTLSEKTDSLEGIKDATEDVIAAGCILFYYLKRGKHLFGYDLESILINLKEKNPVNLWKLGENHFAYEPIKNMIIPPGKGFNWLHIANEKFKEALSLRVNTSKLLGSGTYGYVYEGKFNGDRVAVKQMTTTTAQKKTIQREMNSHIDLNHVNVVKLLDVADSADNRFTQLVLELCSGTLADYCEKKYNGPKLPPDELVLYQIANGLHYIHSRNLVHRDIKPENILISKKTPVKMKVSDLSFVKKTREDIFSQSKIRGTLQWMAPERLKILNDNDNKTDPLPDGTIKSDTFSCGCVFFYFLTRGTHPFGKNQATVPANILLNKPEEFDSHNQNLTADEVNGRILAGLIGDMIQCKEEERIGLPEVIKQLATLLNENKDNIKSEFQSIDVSLDVEYSIRSHPTEPILARAVKKELIFYTAENSSIPFSNWRKKVTCLPQILVGKKVVLLEWNCNRTQLAVGAYDGTLVVWSYPECEILFQGNISVPYDLRSPVEWNPTVPSLFATFHWVRNPTSRSVFIAVISATENVLNREKIRKTWKNHVAVVLGKGLLSVARFAFVLGRTNDNLLQSKIRGESMLHGDILQLDILDFYRNLPFKMAGLLNWMNINCPKIGFLLKVDDDVYVNVHNVAKMVESYHQTGKFSIFGRSQNFGFPPDRLNNFGPARDPNRYQITLEAWPWNTYPDYIIGPAYLIHGSSILPLLAAMQTTPINPFEDVYVTGICPEKAGIKVLYSSGTTSLYAHSPFDDECEARKYLAWDDWLSPLSHEQIDSFYSGATNRSCDSPNASIKFNFRSNYSTFP
ncbi:hypothetical protein GHT06_012301 [Daphnia sinensis]|uniref:Protein kinase domain-containing protein n=1 Tax=Daphnia sinensis TaxID=1820382 RepID=A0AAD5PYQ2_9CRUS|nr:hypothetical protein GHT06_012301 [Daphnia sinensis]